MSLSSTRATLWGRQSHPHATFNTPYTKENNHLRRFTLHWWSDSIPSWLTTIHNILYYIYTIIRVLVCVCVCVCVKTCEIQQRINPNAGRVIVVATGTRYGLYGSVFEPHEVGIFRAGSGRPLGPPSPLHSAHQMSFQRVKRWGRGVDHPPPSRAGVTEKFLVSLQGLWVRIPPVAWMCLLWVLCVVRDLCVGLITRPE